MSSIAQKIDFTMLSDDEPETCELSINSMSSDELLPAVDGVSPPPAARLFHPPSMTSSPRRPLSRLPAPLCRDGPHHPLSAGQTPAAPKPTSRLARDRLSSTSPSPPYKRIKGELPHYTRVGQRFEGELRCVSVCLLVCRSVCQRSLLCSTLRSLLDWSRLRWWWMVYLSLEELLGMW